MDKDQPTTAVLARAGQDARPSSDGRDVKRPGNGAPGEPHAPLFVQSDAEGLRAQWNDVQAGFVDQPRSAVERADKLVAEVMKRLAESFSRERDNLDRQWDHGDNVTTEDLRLVLQRYRSFFDRLLSL